MSANIRVGSYYRSTGRNVLYRVIGIENDCVRVDNVTEGYSGVYHAGVFQHMASNGDMRYVMGRPVDELIKGAETVAQNLLTIVKKADHIRTDFVVLTEALLIRAVEDAYPNLDARRIVEIFDELQCVTIREAAEKAYAMACEEADVIDLPAGCLIMDAGKTWEVTGRDDSEIFGSVTVRCWDTDETATLSPRYIAAGVAMSRIEIERWN